MTLAFLPRHNLVKFKDELGRNWNLEATSGGGYTRDSYYKDQFRFSERAIETGAYMRALSDDEAIASMAHFVPEWLMKHDRPDDAIAAYTVILRHNPVDVYAWIGRGSSFALILRRDFIGKFNSLSEMTPQQRQDAAYLPDMNKHDFGQAEALGWTENDDLKSATQSAEQEHIQ